VVIGRERVRVAVGLGTQPGIVASGATGGLLALGKPKLARGRLKQPVFAGEERFHGSVFQVAVFLVEGFLQGTVFTGEERFQGVVLALEAVWCRGMAA
jgi:hypothetical protein